MQYIKGSLLVVGGAGSGKTSLLACKIAWLIREYDVDPSQIVVLAANFHTVRALRSAAEELLGRTVPTLSISTFAEFGLTLVQERLGALGLRPGFSLYDRGDTDAIVARLLREARLPAVGPAAAVAAQIACWKQRLAPPPAGEPTSASPAELARWLYPRYEQRLRAANAIDIDDLVRKAVRLLTVDAGLLTDNRSRIRFLLIDEYEQTSACEHELVRLLAVDGMAVTAAGDDTQASDERGHGPADHLARLPNDLPDAHVIRLEPTFRSSARILAAARRIVGAESARPDDAWRRSHGSGAALRVLQARNEHDEAEQIVNHLLSHKARYGTEYRHYGILYRRAEQAPAIERALRARRVPYSVRGGPSFLDQPEVQDVFAYLKLICNPADDAAFLRAINTPRRNIDHIALERLDQFAADRARPLLECTLDAELACVLVPDQIRALRNFADLVNGMIARAEDPDPVRLCRDLLEELHYADWLRDTCNDANIAARRMENVMQLVDLLRRFAQRQPLAGLRTLMTQLQIHRALANPGDDAATEGIALLTFAAARGTEFAHLYIVGFEEGLLPIAQAEGNAEAAGERRLAYLVMTRARDSVTFTIAEHRRVAGNAMPRRASRFLAELPSTDLEWASAETDSGLAENALGIAAARRPGGTRYSP